MSPILLLAAAAALGIEVGWEPIPDGGHEYTIQLEPQMLRVLEAGQEDLFSEVPPGIEIRRFRITMGTGPLPRDAGAPTPAESPAEPAPTFTDPPQHENPGPQVNVGPPPSDDDIPPNDPSPTTFADDDPSGAKGAPAKLPPDPNRANPIKPAKFDDTPSGGKPPASGEETTERPELGGGDPAGRPWGVLLSSVALLCCSLGANIYLGWIAWEARNRYRSAVHKFRTAEAA